jgi:hypothetical protein
MMDANYLGDDVEELLLGALEDVTGSVQVVNPSRETMESLVSCLGDIENGVEVELLADERKLKDVMDDFLVASNAADLLEAGRLTIRVRETLPENALLVSENAVVSLVFAGDRVGGLSTDEDAFVTQAREYYEDQWETADEFSLRTPPLSRVRETLESDIGPETADDFDAVLDSLQTARGNGEGLDEVTISLLVAAKNGELLYDISKWGEDIGLASKATFSRTKTKLEDMGLIDTEKVPIDVGRPRLRLMLGDERLDTAETDELASVAQSLLA